MAKHKKPEQTYWVPMRWTHSGGAWVTAPSADEAVAKAEAGEFNDGVEIHDAGAELIDWEVTGDARLEE